MKKKIKIQNKETTERDVENKFCTRFIILDDKLTDNGNDKNVYVSIHARMYLRVYVCMHACMYLIIYSIMCSFIHTFDLS